MVRISKEAYFEMCPSWKQALVLKVLGRNLLYTTIAERLLKLWKLSSLFVMTDLENHFYVVRFTNKDDYEKFLYGGPWMIGNRYVTVKRWTLSFDAASVGLSKISVWIKFPNLPNKNFLRHVGNHIGKTLRIDETTLRASREKFA